MQIKRANAPEPSRAELEHLDQLRTSIEHALVNGKLSRDEIQSIQALMDEDHRVTVAELTILHETLRQFFGDAALEYDWQ
ncbi:hypothetical protein VB780_29500 [Leptolyngbya sp. CCNP1308]|uniref:hypothetical protein n=1 Tax=Leptolyngbya sp. CCNP1308 TaxID=3110255 RepID=UPI002B210365|nr:hypothetical protein [Leptolyngbya sp. CCNP1308]MEA5452744.1 hypothetical protein [Leptolyngbya sp. CCNP1308]